MSADICTAQSSNTHSVLDGVNITVKFGGVTALSNVSLAIPPNTIVGLLGPNGAGKTTLFSVLSGLRTPDNGRVTLLGRDVTKASPQVRSRMGMYRTFQHPELFATLTVREHIVLADRIRHGRKRVWSDFLTGRGFRAPDSSEAARVDEMLEALDLERVAYQSAANLPLGTSRLVELARALAMGPRVLLLDEPGSGLDTSERHQLVRVLEKVVASQDLALLLVEHDIEMVLKLAKLVFVLDFGECIASGTPGDIRGNSAVQEAYLGDIET